MEKIIATAVGAVIGGMISFISAKLMLKKNSRSSANDKFRASFINELYLLEKARVDVFQILNEDAFEKHELAKLEFEIFLYSKEVSPFNKKWSSYKKYVTNHWGQEVAPGNLQIREDECKKAAGHIKALIKFTKNV